MTFDLRIAEEAIAKAKADLQFWEDAKRILTDPRLAAVGVPVEGRIEAPSYRPYGSVKQLVEQALPEFGEPPITSKQVVTRMRESGYVFNAKQPIVTVNDALASLKKDGRAHLVGTSGVSNLWTLPKEEDASESDSGAS